MSQVKQLFNNIISSGLAGLEKMIGFQDENIFIDFKRKSNLNTIGAERSDRDTFSKAISGFSNAAGGIIIWGIDCRKKDGLDVVQALIPINGVMSFLNDLNAYIPTSIQPLNVGIENQIIWEKESAETGFIVTYIPESDSGPFRSLGDHNYYTRSGNNFIKIDHFMLADMFGKRQRPQLVADYCISASGNVLSRSVRVEIVFKLRNCGRYVATYPAASIIPNTGLKVSEYGVDGNRNFNLRPVLINHSTRRKDEYFFSGGINDVIHPTFSLDLCVLGVPDIFTDTSQFYGKSMNDIAFSIDYVLYAEGCQPLEGKIIINYRELVESLTRNQVENVDHLISKVEV